MDKSIIEAIPTEEVLRLAGNLPASTLQYWHLKGLVRPTHRADAGTRYSRLWSLQDVIVIRTIRALRSSGCPLQRIRSAVESLSSEWSEVINENVLYWNGTDLLRVGQRGEIESTWRSPGQMMFASMAQLPIGEWRAAAIEKLDQYYEDDLNEYDGRLAYKIRKDEDPTLHRRRKQRAAQRIGIALQDGDSKEKQTAVWTQSSSAEALPRHSSSP